MFFVGICDDEKGTCAELENLLYQYGKRHGLKLEVSVWYTGEGLCEFLEKGSKLDVLFLDIELISTDGIKIGNYIREELEDMDTAIVYISSKSSYAMSLFRVQPLDFLIKPLKAEMIEDVMNRAVKQYRRKNQIFEFHAQGNHFKIPYKEILYFCSENKKIHIVCREQTLQFNGKLKDVAKRMPDSFVLIHQSYLVNLDFVMECSYDKVRMQNGDELNISQPYRKTVRGQIIRSEWEKIK